jgi:hypothetical protein
MGLVCVSPSHVHGETDHSILIGTVFMEGLFVGMSALASNYPSETGTGLMIFSPLLLLPNLQGGGTPPLPVRIFGAASILALGAYDVRLDDKLAAGEVTGEQIFWRNFGVWNAVLLTVAVADYFYHEDDERKRYSLDYGPIEGGGAVVLSYYW